MYYIILYEEYKADFGKRFIVSSTTSRICFNNTEFVYF